MFIDKCGDKNTHGFIKRVDKEKLQTLIINEVITNIDCAIIYVIYVNKITEVEVITRMISDMKSIYVVIHIGKQKELDKKYLKENRLLYNRFHKIEILK